VSPSSRSGASFSRGAFLLIVVLVAVVAAVQAGSAGAVPAIGCGHVKVHKKSYSVRAHVLSCRKARPWTVNYLSGRGAPRGYHCRRFSPKITRVVFVCDNPKTASRADGPQSFTAGRLGS
jgi:hypothetical protein